MEITDLIIRYDNDLRRATEYELEHAYINGHSLSDCVLPENFFEHLFNRHIGGVIFSDLDFSRYNVEEVLSFTDCTFEVNTKFTDGFFYQMSNKSEAFKGCKFEIDFTRLNVNNVDFRGVTFTNNTIFTRDFFHNTMNLLYPLYECKFNNVDFNNIDLSTINIEGAEFNRANLPKDFFQKLPELNITNCTFKNIDLSDVNLGGVQFNGCEFYGNVVFPQDFFQNIEVLNNCTLKDVNLSRYIIESESLRTTKIDGEFGLNRENFQWFYNIIGQDIMANCFKIYPKNYKECLYIVKNSVPPSIEYAIGIVDYIINSHLSIDSRRIMFRNNLSDEIRLVLINDVNTITHNITYVFD